MVDPGFPVWGVLDPLAGGTFLTQALFGENVCENERIGSRRGGAPGTPPRSANAYLCRVTMIIKATLEHFPVKPYQNVSLHIQSDLQNFKGYRLSADVTKGKRSVIYKMHFF